MFEFILTNPFLAAVLALLALGLVFGAVLGFGAITFKVEGDPIVDQINAILPQTQCGQCGYPGCKPYAEAIANGDLINKCPPGGEAGIHALADLLDVKVIALDDEHGMEDIRKIAYIREDECIGCTKCIQACPVDAILGAAKLMHTVIVSECTGCDLCVEPCPVDCIDMLPVVTGKNAWSWDLPNPTINASPIIASDRELGRKDAAA
jgi:electron transport complex protein RnfB